MCHIVIAIDRSRTGRAWYYKAFWGCGGKVRLVTLSAASVLHFFSNTFMNLSRLVTKQGCIVGFLCPPLYLLSPLSTNCTFKFQLCFLPSTPVVNYNCYVCAPSRAKECSVSPNGKSVIQPVVDA